MEPNREPTPRQRGGRSFAWITLGVLVAALVVLGFALPRLLRDAINGAIARDPAYEGGVDHVRLRVLDLGAALEGVDVSVVAEDDLLRHVTADRVDLDLGLGSLAHLGAIGTVTVVGWDVELRQTPEEAAEEAAETVSALERVEEEQQAGQVPTVAEALADLPMFDLDVVVREGRITWTDPAADATLAIDAVTGRIDHLTNRDRGGSVARGVFTATVAGEGTASVQFTSDPLVEPLGGTLDLDAVGIPLPALNRLLRERLPVGFAAGTATARLNADYHPHTLSGESEEWTYAGLDLRGLDFEGSLAVDEVRPVAEALPGREVSVPHADVAAVWHPARQDRIQITGRVDEPRIVLTRAGALAALGETGPPLPAPAELPPSPLLELPPFELTRFTVNDAWVRFLDTSVAPDADVVVRDLTVRVEDLTNRRDRERLATVTVDGTMAGGEIDVKVRLDPLATSPTFSLDARLDHLHLVEMQDVLMAYAGLAVGRGTVSLSSEVAAADQAFDGYVKAVVDDLEVFTKRDWKEGLGAGWEALVGTGAEILENQAHDRTGVRVPLRGELTAPRANVAQAVVSVLRNAFVRVMLPGVEGSVGRRDDVQG